MHASILVELERAGVVESRHRGGLVVVDGRGHDVHVEGDPDQRLFIRSAVKPFAAALVVAAGAVDAYGIRDGELAIMAASHSGRDEDVAAVRSVLERIGCGVNALATAPGLPEDHGTATRMESEGEPPTAAHHMCSGAHAALLAWSKHQGAPTDGYWHEEHPAQRALGDLVARVLGDGDRPATAIDDCGVPTWHVTLRSMARAYGWLARPECLPDHLADLRPPFARVRDAMLAFPDRISGVGQLDTDLTAAGGFVAKEGAEGSLGIGSVASGLGVAFTIEDGDLKRRAAGVVALWTLGGLGLLEDDVIDRLQARHWAAKRDPHGREVATYRAAFRVPRPD